MLQEVVRFDKNAALIQFKVIFMDFWLRIQYVVQLYTQENNLHEVRFKCIFELIERLGC